MLVVGSESIRLKSSSMSALYVNSSKRSGEGVHLLAWVNEKTGDEVKGDAVTGYGLNIPLVARGEDRAAERAGEEGGGRWRGGEEGKFLAAILESACLYPTIYENRAPELSGDENGELVTSSCVPHNPSNQK